MSYLEMRGITRLYKESGVLANDKVDLSVEKNEIHAIVGENGAGKSTLMKILYGLEQPDQGTITFKGKEAAIANPLDADRLGIGMVHQHFRLIPEFTILENIVLGIEPKKHSIFFDREKARNRVMGIIKEYGFKIEPGLTVSQLTFGQMQLVEILKMLYRQADLLILDEPTSVLTEQEIKKLFTTLRNLKKIGKTVIIISHKLKEVKEISDRVTVMRKGKVSAVKKTSEVDRKELSRLMVGKSVLYDIEKTELACGFPVLVLKEVSLKQKNQDIPLLDKLNLTVHSSEIVGIAGVGGNGLAELEDVVTGLRRISSGEIYYNKKRITNSTIHELREQGLCYVPADRLYRGSSLQASVKENLIIASSGNFRKAGIMSQKRVQGFADTLTAKYSINGDTALPIGYLSGGNIQKVILARELEAKADLIVFSEPAWGLDIENSEFVYKKILKLREQGSAILLISSDLQEILALADRVVVMYRGRIAADLVNREITKELIGEYMHGISGDFEVEMKGSSSETQEKK